MDPTNGRSVSLATSLSPCDEWPGLHYRECTCRSQCVLEWEVVLARHWHTHTGTKKRRKNSGTENKKKTKAKNFQAPKKQRSRTIRRRWLPALIHPHPTCAVWDLCSRGGMQKDSPLLDLGHLPHHPCTSLGNRGVNVILNGWAFVKVEWNAASYSIQMANTHTLLWSGNFQACVPIWPSGKYGRGIPVVIHHI